eukprot:12593388-Alexandrium_andersonii.AAC.1
MAALHPDDAGLGGAASSPRPVGKGPGEAMHASSGEAVLRPSPGDGPGGDASPSHQGDTALRGVASPLGPGGAAGVCPGPSAHRAQRAG